MESLIDLESAIRRLESSVDSLDWWLTFWTAVVVLGLLIEYAHDLWKLVWRRPFDWSLLRPVVGGILITLGVTGELFVGFKLSTVETELRAANDKVVAFLNRETSAAQRGAAEANGKAEQERLARVKIEERLADRVLTDAQVERIKGKVELFAGQEYGVVTYWDLREPLSLANRIHESLTLAKWKYLEPTQAQMLLGGTSGVDVYVHPDAHAQVQTAATALVSVLVDENIETELRQQDTANNPKHNTLYVHIGTKP